jgi:large subunit ribosomal protein L5
MAKLHDFYKETVVAELAKQFGYKSVMQVPRIEKITLNMGLGEAVADKKVLENASSSRHGSDCRSETYCHCR